MLFIPATRAQEVGKAPWLENPLSNPKPLIARRKCCSSEKDLQSTKCHWTCLIWHLVKYTQTQQKERADFHCIQNKSEKHKIPFKAKYYTQLGSSAQEERREGGKLLIHTTRGLGTTQLCLETIYNLLLNIRSRKRCKFQNWDKLDFLACKGTRDLKIHLHWHSERFPKLFVLPTCSKVQNQTGSNFSLRNEL